MTLDPLFDAAVLTSTIGKPLLGSADFAHLHDALHDRAKAVRGNKLASLENMLTGQAATLNAIFSELTRRAVGNMGENFPAMEGYMRLALKAQTQCRATLETLAAIKNPPVAYTRQTNISNGPQQVNNGGGLPARKSSGPPNELLETEHGKRLDAGTAGAAVESDPALEAVGPFDGATDGGRKSKREPQRL